MLSFLISPPLFFFLSVLQCPPPPGLSRQEMLQLHTSTLFLSSLCDAISDYIVITNALAVCSQPNMSKAI